MQSAKNRRNTSKKNAKCGEKTCKLLKLQNYRHFLPIRCIAPWFGYSQNTDLGWDRRRPAAPASISCQTPARATAKRPACTATNLHCSDGTTHIPIRQPHDPFYSCHRRRLSACVASAYLNGIHGITHTHTNCACCAAFSYSTAYSIQITCDCIFTTHGDRLHLHSAAMYYTFSLSLCQMPIRFTNKSTGEYCTRSFQLLLTTATYTVRVEKVNASRFFAAFSLKCQRRIDDLPIHIHIFHKQRFFCVCS